MIVFLLLILIGVALNIFAYKKMPESLGWFLPASAGFIFGICQASLLYTLYAM